MGMSRGLKRELLRLLQECMSELGVSQQELGEHLGMTQARVSQIFSSPPQSDDAFHRVEATGYYLIEKRIKRVIYLLLQSWAGRDLLGEIYEELTPALAEVRKGLTDHAGAEPIGQDISAEELRRMMPEVLDVLHRLETVMKATHRKPAERWGPEHEAIRQRILERQLKRDRERQRANRAKKDSHADQEKPDGGDAKED